ncbi:hypothetical protein HKD42_02340 [Altererythrobacter sp. RZ02]|uniref:Uncharacterized protein n=1 Tax=Pontixanthobacter rizhaonensis TaxID=2730337 RepID=A0A848QJX1_9SPHN|nr:hypothetical protein [Pontixanthobacter rizhaonensis]NMW30897.1 hypothetical protein [Pontixanthobacter rizhaonensis]
MKIGNIKTTGATLALTAMCFGIAGCSMPGGEGGYSPADAANGAAFRVEASEAFGRLDPVCPFTDDADQLARYDEPRARYAALKEWVSGTPFATDLAIIEADYQQYWATNSVDCGPKDTEEGMIQFNAELEEINIRLNALEQLAGVV